MGYVVLVDPIQKEVHVVALEGMLAQSLIEVGGIQRHRNAPHNMVRYHTIKR